MKAFIIPVVLLAGMAIAPAQSPPADGLYLITGGRFEACCGLLGSIVYPLPNSSQSYVRLDVDAQRGTASLVFLGEDQGTIFSVPACPPTLPIPFSFTHGLVFSNQIVFRADPGPLPGQTWWNYSVSNTADGLRIQGTLGTSPGGCADFPNQFGHTNVVATPLPTLAIRTSEVEVCWNSISNRNHQVQYRPSLGTNGWANLGEPLPGNGSTLCITDPVPPGEPRRFYRVLTLP